MKNIIKVIALAGIAVSTAACNKAHFVEEKFVSLASDRLSVTDDGSTLKVPIMLYGADECVITYVVTDDTAQEGADYQVVDRNGKPDNTGVLTVSNTDKTADNAIYIKVTDKSGAEQGNLTFNVTIKDTAEEGIAVGAFKNCKCIIVDKDLGLPKLVGSYTGEGTDEYGDPMEFTFSIQEYDPTKDPDTEYPEANCIIADGSIKTVKVSFANPIYAFFDINTSQIYVYGLQVFNTYNFTGLGVADVALGISSQAEMEDDFIIETDVKNGVLELVDALWIWVLDSNGGALGAMGGFDSGYKWTKNK